MSRKVDRMFETCDCDCDNCGESVIVNTMSLKKAKKDLIKKGWVIEKINNKICDFCCRECFLRYKYGHYE